MTRKRLGDPSKYDGSDESQCESAGSTFWHFVLAQSAGAKGILPGSSASAQVPPEPAQQHGSFPISTDSSMQQTALSSLFR